MSVVDTNILLRQLTGDNPEHSQRALAFLQGVESGERSVYIPESVVTEVVWVLASKSQYSWSRAEIRDDVGAILGLRGVRTQDRNILLDALDLFVDQPQLSFVDCLCAAHAQHSGDPTVYSFDRDFRRVEGVSWLEP